MAIRRSFMNYVEQELGKFPHFLIYAVLEWVLIFVLFIDGFLSFLANQYAKFFELETPCLFCTRIDHVFVHRDAEFYCNDSICDGHKKDVSSMAYCHVHKKLSDIRQMCEGCLLSFATQKESDCDTYKSLVGILHKDVETFVDDDSDIHVALPSARKDDQKSTYGVNRCMCCGEALKVKPYPKGKKGSLLAQAPTPSPRAPILGLRNDETRGMELPHMNYKELKFSSENERDILDDVSSSNASLLEKQIRDDLKGNAMPLLNELDYMHEERTPTFSRGNKFFGIPLDSATNSPRWGGRLGRKSLLEKTEIALDQATEVSTSGDQAEGDSMLQHLKRQVKLDGKSLMALYMELDEERSASAIAANNALAMITRLQADKAAVQMEALQYQRMMEEQAEYDQEALQDGRDLLNKKDELIKALENELEAYREKHGMIREEEFMGYGDEVDEDYHGSVSPAYSSRELQNNGKGQSPFFPDQNVEKTQHNPPKGPPTTKSGCLARLRNLDKTLQVAADEGAPSSTPHSDHFDHMEEETEKDEETDFISELSLLHDRVKALEGGGGLEKQAGKVLQNTSEKGKILADISNNLQKLCHIVTNIGGDDDDARVAS